MASLFSLCAMLYSMNIPHLIYPFYIADHHGSFQSVAIRKRTAINIPIHDIGGHMHIFLLGIYLGVKGL